MCLETTINVVNAVCTLALAAVAIWQDQVLNFLNPTKGGIAESNFDGKEEGISTQRSYTYHVQAFSQNRWRPLRGAMIRFREIHRTRDAGKLEKSFYPVWRQLPWAPSERCEILQTIIDEQESDLGSYEKPADRFVIAYYQQGGEFNPYVERGEIARIFLHLHADNFRRDAVVEITIDMTGVRETKPKVGIKNTV